MAFDIDGARSAGYSDAEIADYLGKQNNFDTSAAFKAGYSSSEIIDHLNAPSAPKEDGGLLGTVRSAASSAGDWLENQAKKLLPTPAVPYVDHSQDSPAKPLDQDDMRMMNRARRVQEENTAKAFKENKSQAIKGLIKENHLDPADADTVYGQMLSESESADKARMLDSGARVPDKVETKNLVDSIINAPYSAVQGAGSFGNETLKFGNILAAGVAGAFGADSVEQFFFDEIGRAHV